MNEERIAQLNNRGEYEIKSEIGSNFKRKATDELASPLNSHTTKKTLHIYDFKKFKYRRNVEQIY